jgi:HlyD family secretion protein
MAERTGASWIVYALGALVVGAIVAAVLLVGPASGQQATQTRTITARRGVVQSTVSGSGNVQAASQLDLGFKTSGTITQIDVTQGEQVAQGQLLATLDPQSTEVTLEQAKATLQSAEANLAREEETDGESSSGQSSGSQSSASGSSAAAGSGSSATTASIAAAPTPSASSPSTSSPTASSPPASSPSASSPATPEAAAETRKRAATTTTGAAPSTSKTKAKRKTGGAESSGSSGSSSANNGSASGSSSAGSSISSATRAANIASARAAVKSDRLTVKGGEEAVADTKLLAPQDGTIVSLTGEVGETVSGGGTSRASASSESSSGGGSTAAGGSAATAGGGSSGSSSSSSSSGSSSASFAVLSDLSSMKLVVPLSESEVGSVKAGQPATVTVEALKSAKLAAHVSEVAALSTSNSGVVSYDVTFQLDQLETGLKPGMSATAEVVVSQAEGVNVPTSAITGGSVTVIHDGKQQRREVTTGLAGDSATIVLSGLKAGEEVALPLTSTSSSATNLLSRFAGRTGGAAGGLGGGGFAGGGLAGGRAGGASLRGAGGYGPGG